VDDPVTIKIGVHEGPCIAVTLNDRLDYFGTTVNMAARLEGQSQGADIVLSQAMADNPAVQVLTAEATISRESAELWGFADSVPFYRMLMNGPKAQ